MKFLKNLIPSRPKIFARNCTLTENSTLIADFIEQNHLQGYAPSKTHLGLLYEEKIVAAVTLGPHPRNAKKITLNRVCYSDFQVIGGLEKMLNKIPRPIYTWSDNSYSPFGGMYIRAGFELEEELPPDYFYTTGDSRYISKQSQKKASTACPSDLSEAAWARERKLYRVWDCGKCRWVLK